VKIGRICMNFSSDSQKEIEGGRSGTTIRKNIGIVRTTAKKVGEGSHRGYAVGVNEPTTESAHSRVGLCAGCRFTRRIESDRGSIFYLCERSATDARFPKYPRLPVLQCAGYEPDDGVPTRESPRDGR
jgi:hypothetical protein